MMPAVCQAWLISLIYRIWSCCSVSMTPTVNLHHQCARPRHAIFQLMLLWNALMCIWSLTCVWSMILSDRWYTQDRCCAMYVITDICCRPFPPPTADTWQPQQKWWRANALPERGEHTRCVPKPSVTGIKWWPGRGGVGVDEPRREAVGRSWHIW